MRATELVNDLICEGLSRQEAIKLTREMMTRNEANGITELTQILDSIGYPKVELFLKVTRP